MTGVDSDDENGELTAEDFDVDREQMKREAEQNYRERQQQQANALEQIAEGTDIQDHETAQLGELELTVKAWVPGGVEESLSDAMSVVNSGDADAEAVAESQAQIRGALARMTDGDTYDRRFWDAYHDKFGAEGLLLAADTVFAPARERMEEREEAVDQFPAERRGAKPRTSSGDVGDHTRRTSPDG